MTGTTDALPTPSSTSFEPAGLQRPSEEHFQRRLRHLIAIQIRNLTPFPVRDAFASALSQPAGHSQFTPLGNLSDDLDVALLRRRSRRISSTSINTVHIDDINGTPEDMRVSGEARGRKRTQSRVSFSGGGSAGPSSGAGGALSRSLANTTSAPATRQSRIRTASMVSSRTLSASLPVVPSGSVSNIHSASAFYFDHSQRTLEKVVQSRLVETFLTISVPGPSPPSLSPPMINGKSRSRAESGPSPSPPEMASFHTARKGVRMARSGSIGAAKTLSNVTGGASRLTIVKGKPQSMSKPAPPITMTHRPSPSVPLQKSSSHQTPLPSSAELAVFPKVPNYISPIHRPSTNPIYSLDALSHSDFAESTDLGADKLKIQLWAKVDFSGMHHGGAKGKQKESDRALSGSGPGWKVLEEWDLFLADLIPLSPELENHPSQLPSNTLVMSFLPTSQAFYLPPPSWSRSRSHSRSPSPSGYNTDPETEGRKLIQAGEPIPSISHEIIRGSQSLLSVPRRSRKLEARTASSQELLQLANVQVSIRETEESLHDVVREINHCLAQGHASVLSRDASERQERILDRRAETQAIIERSNQLRDEIASRRVQIQARRDYLEKARESQAQEATTFSEKMVEVAEERSDLNVLRNRISPTRTSLISILASIYPIELLSPSELLFTILAVPLPIPFQPNEPAPPLSLSSHKEVNEDSVATALGYAAHVVQLLSVYMGKGLVYPITYVGSRSLIRDNISAMVGPRMFPLFSKGVDTYRFEYAVFLLNKDIEMLMADRDLRALDMRHTLPNLKNLLLTLTDGECASPHNPRLQDSPSSVGLATPPRASSPLATNRSSETPKAGRSPERTNAELPGEQDGPQNSGATTPKASQLEGGTLSRYSKLSLVFPPLSGFLRSRNSPTTPHSSIKSNTDATEELQEGGTSTGAPSGSSALVDLGRNGKPEDDDDRRTIKGVIADHTEPSVTSEVKEAANRLVANEVTSAEEKLPDETSLTSRASTVVSVDTFL